MTVPAHPTTHVSPSAVQVPPVVFEELRQEVDDEMRLLIKSIKASGHRGRLGNWWCF